MLGENGQKFGDNPEKNVFPIGMKIHLIDFGFADSYIKNGAHIKCKDTNNFKGNVLFSSTNQMRFKKTSRRDDLESLVYLLISLIKESNFLDEEIFEIECMK